MVSRDSLMEMLESGMSTEEVARKTGLDLVDGSEVEWHSPPEYSDIQSAILFPGWLADDGHMEKKFASASSGAEASQEYVSGGDWGSKEKTQFIQIWTWREGLGVTDEGDIHDVWTYRKYFTESVDPDEPECTEANDHIWSSYPWGDELDGIRTHGCGNIFTTACKLCGAVCKEDTWAHNPLTGEEGLHSVTYEPPGTVETPPMWDLETGSDGADEDGLEGNYKDVLSDVLYNHDLEDLPEGWEILPANKTA